MSFKDLKKIRLVIVAGGWSSERSVSINSGKNVFNTLKKNGYKVPSLDLGGGIRIHYDSNKKPDFDSYKKIISNLFLKSDYQLSFEPGRSLIAEAGVLVTKVIRNKKNKSGGGVKFKLMSSINDIIEN